MYRQYALSKRGKCVLTASTMLELGLLRHYLLLAPHTSSGTMKASLFEKWFEEEVLKKLPKEHIIIIDNAAFYKKEVLY